MPCAAQTNRSVHASLLAAKSPLSARLPTPVGRSYRRYACRSLISAIGAVEQAQAQAKRRPEYVPGRIEDPNYVRIFDTTLRDGEQSPGNVSCNATKCNRAVLEWIAYFRAAGATLTSKEKLDIARQLAKLGVDIIEAGFPVASPDDFEAVRSIAMDVGNAVDEDGYVPVICGLSRSAPVVALCIHSSYTKQCKCLSQQHANQLYIAGQSREILMLPGTQSNMQRGPGCMCLLRRPQSTCSTSSR